MAAILDRIPAMVQGAGALRVLGARAAALAGGGPTLLVADPGLRGAGVTDAALAQLRGAGLDVLLFEDIRSDPDIAQADRGAALAREGRAACVVALGGGSAMDVGKIIAAIAPGAGGAASHGLAAAPFLAAPLPKICIPTTAGTGSETTRTAILADADHAKIWFWGDALKADLAILDPELTVGLPPFLTAATAIDALAHAIEASTNRNANPVNDLYCHAAIGLVVQNLERALERPDDREARGALQIAAAFAGVGIDNAGTAAGHMIGHALGSLRPIHHGHAVGLALLATLDWNCAEDDGAFAAVAAAMGEPGEARRVGPAFEALMRRAGLSLSLADSFAGVSAEQLAAQIARPENEAMRRSNRRVISDDDIAIFAQRVLSQA